MQTKLFSQCDELDIIYYGKDSFVFKNFDTSSIKKYIELITLKNDASAPDCDANCKLIFKRRGQQLFTAEISTGKDMEGKTCNTVRYMLDSKEYKHMLTYRVGMGIDAIYWHRYSPKENPWTGLDTTNFRYEDLK